MKIEIPKDIEPQITSRAQRAGTTPEAVAIAALREKFAAPRVDGDPPDDVENGPTTSGGTQPRNLAEFLGDFVGCVSSKSRFPNGSTAARNASSAFGEMLEEERQKRKTP